jgi:hypothetical protein
MSDLFHVNTASFGDILISSSVKAAIGADIDLSDAAQVTGKFTGDGSGLTNVTASNSELANTSSYSTFAETASLATDLYFEDATHGSVPFFRNGRLYRDSIITACSESLSIGHDEEVSTWLALGPASTNKVSLHVERATATPNVYTTPAGSLFIGPDCGMVTMV